MPAPADRTNEQYYWAAINDVDFQNRCVLQFATSAISVTTETASATTNAATTTSPVLNFASGTIPGTVVAGSTAVDLFAPSAIPAGTVVKSTTATTVTLNASVTVASGDTIVFSPPSHTPRLALAGQILAGQFSPQQLAIWVVENTTIQSEIVTDATHAPPNGIGNSIADSDIAFQINSIFTGLATSLPTTAQSTI